jgi:hypothetical protein
VRWKAELGEPNRQDHTTGQDARRPCWESG